jgi:hypothetical protein
MSKTWIWVLVAIVVIVGGFWAVFGAKNMDQTSEVSDNTTSVPEEKKMAFSDFIKQGGAYKCSVAQNVGGISTNGITYIDSGRVRGEYTATVQGTKVDSTMILRDGYTYSWSSMMPGQGFKTKVATSATGNTSAPSSGAYSFNADAIGDYNCEAWSVDESKFTVPTNITFKTVSSQ